MKLADIIRANIQFVEASGVDVEVNSSMSWVSITDQDGGEVFLQGGDADQFIERAKADYNHPEMSLTMHGAYMNQAYDYLSILS